MTNPLLQVTDLSKHYKEVKAVDEISFSIQAGQCFGLLGPNGAGKTTTIEMLEGIIAPTSGSIVYKGKPITRDIANEIGIQFQHTALQDFLTVKETLQLFASFYEQTVSIESLIEVCDLADFLDRDNRLLSGGQRQRLLLAIALINDPQIVFLDEPTTGLDPQARRNFWTLIKRIKAQGKTVVLTTHYMDEAEQLCDHIVIVDKGKIIESGSPRQLLNRHFDKVFMYLPSEHIDQALAQEHQWQVNGDSVEIQTQDVEETLSLLLSKGASLEGLHVKSANLDDLFLKLTGHSLRE
ncbi:ABC transporter ATP-binding protein [Thalassotalea agarivorans]|uniref:ABC-2 type transport system ATP-binding protein n=1 Tax=Thalassotalea agarivorans TaxID=349064 RepID=A0A1H9ZCN9_THASX|nr:ABC transporter ATP-binding protein [Thalassotalea agarivorans]SES79406.1 ABC-2 type transport system ATP-binding protein [Thalassotalea agarivorans]